MTVENNSSVEQENKIDEVLPNKEFGAPLKEAREKAGLTIEDVAQQLLIPKDTIIAIEDSQLDKLPSATFVIGYVRSYARILNISADSIIAAYNCIIPAEKNHMEPSPFVPAEESNTGNKTALIMVLIIVLLLLMAWLFQSTTSPEREQAHYLENTSDFNDTFVQQSDDTVEPVFFGEEGTAIDTANEAANDVVALSDDNNKNTTVNDELILTAIGESWCEVFDASGKRLLYQLMNVNEEVKLYGQAPFKVFLGNASQVRIEANKKIVRFDQLIVSNKNIANIVITADSQAVSNNSNR